MNFLGHNMRTCSHSTRAPFFFFWWMDLIDCRFIRDELSKGRYDPAITKYVLRFCWNYLRGL
jgi:hypothetical protein